MTDTNIEDAQIISEEKFKTDEQIDADLSREANTAESASAPPPPDASGSATPPPGSASATLGPETHEAETIYDEDEIRDVDDLASGTVELLEMIRENIIAPLYKRQEYAKVNPVLLNKTLSKMRTSAYQKGSRIELTFTEEEEAVMAVIQDVNVFELSSSYDIRDPDGNIVKARKEGYIKKWARFYESLGWAQKIPPWVQLGISVVMIEGFYVFPVLKNWWEARKRPHPLQQQPEKPNDE